MHRLIGHAITSADDRIADASGRMPETLRNEADWALFQAALDRAALTLIGRASHAATSNRKRRRRLIVSGSASGLEQRADGMWLNPADVSVGEALGRVLPDGGEVAVVGGQGVFELVGAAGFTAFHLARARQVRLPGGRGLFAACEHGVLAASVLSGFGLIADDDALLDPEAEVTLTIWRQPA
jgi:hypothetical protein